jgi:hypothetical protein
LPDFIYEFFIITIVGGVLVGLILIALKKIKINTFYFFKFRLRRTLNKYIRNSINKKKERKIFLKLDKLIGKALEKENILKKLGFQPFGNKGIEIDKFRLYFKKGFKFTIKDLKNSQAFFSNNFEEGTLKKSVDGALHNFIEHLKK